MDHPGDSPASSAIRRRIWRFVFGSLFVVAVVALWPLKGYKVDEEIFYRSLLAEGNSDGRRKEKNIWNVMDVGGISTWRTGGEAREMLETLAEFETRGGVPTHLTGIKTDVIVLNEDNSGSLVLGFQYCNVVGVLTFDINVLPPGENRVNEGGETISLVIDGIEREIPGVTTFYNPAARQLWIDRVRPFLSKHFPKLVPYDSPFGSHAPWYPAP